MDRRHVKLEMIKEKMLSNKIIYVVKGNGSALLGRDILKKKLNRTFVNKVHNPLNTVPKEYPTFFSDKLGKIKNF